MDYYYDDDKGGRRWPQVLGIVALVAAVGAGAFWALRSDDGKQKFSANTVVDSSAGATVTGADTALNTVATLPSVFDDSVPPASSATTASSAATASVAGPTPGTRSVPPATTLNPGTTSTSATAAATPTTPTIAATTTTVSEETTTVPAAATDGPYPTNPDGTPLPIVVIFDTTTITITGNVPSQAAMDRLTVLAKANSQFPDAAVVNNMVINDKVPIEVGVRVIELNSARFPAGTAQILPAQAAEFDRVVNVMNALPNISVLVIGHADQRGTEAANFAISDERARAVVNYLRFLGISPTRLSSRAAGASDLLSVTNDEEALALNRRTEFIFYGLLIE